MAPGWLWIALAIAASFAQTVRNAAQRSLVAEAGALGATLTRFLFGLPFALVWFAIVLAVSGSSLPSITSTFVFWVFEAGVCQIVATALLLRVMADRNFAIGVAYSKTELVQVAVFATVFLGDPVSLLTVLAIASATVGVLMLSPGQSGNRRKGMLQGWTSKTAIMGAFSGAGFALAAVGYRGAALELDEAPFTLAAASTLVWAQTIQSALLGGYLLWRNTGVFCSLFRAWRISLAAGFMGAAASAGWFTAMAIEPVANVRTLGLFELLFSIAAAHRLFREHLGRIELAGVGLLTVALVLITTSS